MIFLVLININSYISVSYLWETIIMKKALLLFTLLLVGVMTFGQVRQRETYYQQKFAEVINGNREFVLEDRTRVDIVTDTHVIEVGYGEKWAESIGKSLHFEGMLNKQAGILLVIDMEKEERFLDRLMGVAAKYGIDVWIWNWTDDTWSKVDYKFEIKYIY